MKLVNRSWTSSIFHLAWKTVMSHRFLRVTRFSYFGFWSLFPFLRTYFLSYFLFLHLSQIFTTSSRQMQFSLDVNLLFRSLLRVYIDWGYIYIFYIIYTYINIYFIISYCSWIYIFYILHNSLVARIRDSLSSCHFTIAPIREQSRFDLDVEIDICK